MRYAKHKGGRKYDSNHDLLPETVNEEKIECAQVIHGYIMTQTGRLQHSTHMHALWLQKFRVMWKEVEADPKYQELKARHQGIEKQRKAAA